VFLPRSIAPARGGKKDKNVIGTAIKKEEERGRGPSSLGRGFRGVAAAKGDQVVPIGSKREGVR